MSTIYEEIFRIERNLRVVAKMIGKSGMRRSKMDEILEVLGEAAGDLEEVIPDDVYTEIRTRRLKQLRKNVVEEGTMTPSHPQWKQFRGDLCEKVVHNGCDSQSLRLAASIVGSDRYRFQ